MDAPSCMDGLVDFSIVPSLYVKFKFPWPTHLRTWHFLWENRLPEVKIRVYLYTYIDICGSYAVTRFNGMPKFDEWYMGNVCNYKWTSHRHVFRWGWIVCSNSRYFYEFNSGGKDVGRAVLCDLFKEEEGNFTFWTFRNFCISTSISKVWNDNMRISRLQIGWDNSLLWVLAIQSVVCGVMLIMGDRFHGHFDTNHTTFWSENTIFHKVIVSNIRESWCGTQKNHILTCQVLISPWYIMARSNSRVCVFLFPRNQLPVGNLLVNH